MKTSVCAVAAAFGAAYAASLPIVDLGYAVHQATLNETGNYYTFSNIRYGEPPVGDLRFAKPIQPQTIDRTLNDGSVARICPQAYPDWLLQQQADARGIPLWLIKLAVAADTRQNEDCLMLDVYVPAGIWSSANTTKAPVLVWIHGGGYTLGSKSDSGNPAGLIARAGLSDGDGVIFVSINYRLGMFGFLVGPDVDSNAALYDQRLALEWIQKYIELFGGDKTKVTLVGESAGGGSIMHQITAYGGSVPAPFARAIAQSPVWQTTQDEKGAWDKVLSTASTVALTSIDNADDLRSLLSLPLWVVNQNVVAESFLGSFTFGPAVDGDFTPDIVPQLLANGKFDQSVEVIAAHNSNESIWIFPASATAEDLSTALQAVLFNAPADQVAYVNDVLYPDVLDGSYGYWTEVGRAALIISDAMFTCNTWYLAEAFDNATYNYRFEVPPGIHGQDIAYTFYTGGNDTDLVGSPVIPEVARAMQDYFAAFAIEGDPNGTPGLPAWPLYGDEGTIATFGAAGVSTALDDKNTTRCAYWQSGAWRGTVSPAGR